VKTLQLKREHRRWYVIVVADTEPIPLPTAGREVGVDPAGTSIGCHQCGRRCTRPKQKTVICPVHGLIDADVNAARNIASRAGLGFGQAAPAA
jgi:transposase